MLKFNESQTFSKLASLNTALFVLSNAPLVKIVFQPACNYFIILGQDTRGRSCSLIPSYYTDKMVTLQLKCENVELTAFIFS